MNTLVIQDMLADPEWADVLTDEDKRALTPLFWMHIQPYGEVRLNTGSRLQLARPAPQEPVPNRSPPRPDALAAPRAAPASSPTSRGPARRSGPCTPSGEPSSPIFRPRMRT